MPEIIHREYEGGIPGTWKTIAVSEVSIRAAEAAWLAYSSECQICGAAIDDGELGCPTPEEH